MAQPGQVLDTRQIGQFRVGRAGQVQAEPLLGHGMAILEAGIADRARPQTEPARELRRDPGGIAAGLANTQVQVLTAATGFEGQLLAHLKIGGRYPETTGNNNVAPGARQGRPVGAGPEQAALRCRQAGFSPSRRIRR